MPSDDGATPPFSYPSLQFIQRQRDAIAHAAKFYQQALDSVSYLPQSNLQLLNQQMMPSVDSMRRLAQATQNILNNSAALSARQRAEEVIESFEATMRDSGVLGTPASSAIRPLLETLSAPEIANEVSPQIEALRSEAEEHGFGEETTTDGESPAFFGLFNKLTDAASLGGEYVDPGTVVLIMIVLAVAMLIGWGDAISLFVGMFADSIHDGVNAAVGYLPGSSHNDDCSK